MTTHWSVVLSAREQPSARSAAALETLCRTYWHPLYAFVRRQGHSPADAQDLTQEFFARLLQKEYLHSVARAKGKFRTFLLVLLKRFLADEWDKARAQKRGGGKVFSVDWASAETRFLQQPVDHLTPEKVFEQRWALTLLDQVYARLEREYQEQGRGALFDALQFALTGSRSEVPYVDLARQLQTTEGAIRWRCTGCGNATASCCGRPSRIRCRARRKSRKNSGTCSRRYRGGFRARADACPPGPEAGCNLWPGFPI